MRTIHRVLALALALPASVGLARAGEVHDAAKAGNPEKIKMMIKGNPKQVYACGERGLSPLHCASIEGHKDVVDVLLGSNVDVNAKEDVPHGVVTEAITTPCVLATVPATKLPVKVTNGGGKLRDHEVVLDKDGRLQPWTTYDKVLKWSMNFIKQCPTVPTKFGDDPWYLVTSKFSVKGEFMRNQNCQGSHAYWAMETLVRYYAYTGDADAILPVKRILDRMLNYHSPMSWAWQNVPPTQDDSPDGEYTDEKSEVDKICLTAVAYLKFYKLTGDEKYLKAARGIAATIIAHVGPGSETRSPLPFRVNLKTGEVLDPYTSDMLAPVLLFDELMHLGETGQGVYQATRDKLWQWVLEYPVKNNRWTGYYEDMVNNFNNCNQQTPMETARFMLRHPEMDPEYKRHVAGLLAFVKDRFGKTKRYGATSIKEQDICFQEMSSHTARYASIVAQWFALSQDPNDREEARASFALVTYSFYDRYSQGEAAVNYTGIGYNHPWFADSYFDYLCHIQDGMAELPEMAPADADHILGTDSVIKKVIYQPGQIEYTTFEPRGNEVLRLTFKPTKIMADGKELPAAAWTYGAYHGTPGVLQIRREAARQIVITSR